MAVTDGLGSGLVERVLAAVDGGATCVQLRAKAAEGGEVYAAAAAVMDVLRPLGVPLIVNDRLDIALAAGADGVHLGPNDLPLEAARALAPTGFLIGGSAGGAEVGAALVAAGADYLGVGAVFDASGSKPDASAPRGVGVLTRVRAAVDVPIVAIGGVDAGNAGRCVAAGASGVAVIRAIFGAADVEGVRQGAQRVRAAVEEGQR